jgi:hypothetical protein
LIKTSFRDAGDGLATPFANLHPTSQDNLSLGIPKKRGREGGLKTSKHLAPRFGCRRQADGQDVGIAGETRPEPRRLERPGWWPMSQTGPEEEEEDQVSDDLGIAFKRTFCMYVRTNTVKSVLISGHPGDKKLAAL